MLLKSHGGVAKEKSLPKLRVGWGPDHEGEDTLLLHEPALPQMLALPLISCVTWGELPSLSGPLSPHPNWE